VLRCLNEGPKLWILTHDYKDILSSKTKWALPSNFPQWKIYDLGGAIGKEEDTYTVVY